jgi:hypothetical protein
MGEIRNIIVFFILLSRKLQFYNNLFFLLLEIFVETHFTFLCSDVLNTIFLKNGIVEFFRFSSNSWFATFAGV